MIFREAGDRYGEGQALRKLGWPLRQKNDPADAQSMFEAALRTLLRDFGSGRDPGGHMALDKIGGGRERKMTQALTAITSADARMSP